VAVDERRVEIGQHVGDRFVSLVTHHAREIPVVLLIRLQQQLADLFA